MIFWCYVINQKQQAMKQRELIIRTPLGEEIYGVYKNNDLTGFVVKGTCVKNIKAYLMLREIFSESHAERNYCKMILTLFEVLPVKEE